MSSQTGEFPGSNRSLVGVLGDLYRSRGLLLGLVAALVGLVIMLLAPSSVVEVVTENGQLTISDGGKGFWAQIQLDDVGTAIFQVGITLVLFQVLLNQVAEDRFVENVRAVLGQQQSAVKLAVAQSLAAGEHVESLRLAPAELDLVIENAARLRSGDPELGKVIARKLRTGVFESGETWRNLVVRAEILELIPAGTDGRSHDYYEVYFHFSYYTTNVTRTRFSFRVAGWQGTTSYDKALRSADLGAAWRLPSTGEFDHDWTNGFQPLNASFGGREVEFIRNETEQEFVCHIPADEFEDDSAILVQYSFSAKVLADGNLLSFEVPKPTFGATYSVNVAVPDIARIRALDYFGATRPASITYTPSLDTVRVVTIGVDDWVLPKAGAILVWTRTPQP
ncbi:hypothetical protein [Actinocorallia sp. A-T 12471]|uniref:hypothetical protein n=1 Tax=Actinocorallia sp. A-T 12471 TaxID=3089813 RepID=UPI0029D3DB5F|nr:hypothetical protein [Actinocorallia sp. A-T 12471]MDX6743812.1 hypothetical protein [Actinocorallia sp. A-T 12471]